MPVTTLAIGGSFVVGNGSCNSYEACYYAGEDGVANIGYDSCNEDDACYYAGEYYGNFLAYPGTCNSYDACHYAGEERPRHSPVRLVQRLRCLLRSLGKRWCCQHWY